MRRITKVLRDLWLTRGRSGFMVLALAAGLTSLGAVLSMRAVLQREMTRNYIDTVPASAAFDVGERGITDSMLESLRRRPEVTWAERRARVEGRWRRGVDQDWGHAAIFVIEDFADQRLALIESEEGERVPPLGNVLVERSAMRVLGAETGDRFEVTTAAGVVVEVQIAGIVHEPALAPAITEQAAYLYVTVETLELFGKAAHLDEVRVLVARDPLDLGAVETQIETLATWLMAEGIEIHEVRIPPPGEHPHQKPSEAVLLLFSFFSCLTVVLAGVLSASLLSITMARQVREIAAMKTIGATSSQILRMYALMLGLISVGALLVSGPPTWALGRLGIDAIAELLNFDITSYAVPWWVIAVQVVTGLALPLLAATPAILGASRTTVRDAMDAHGAGVPEAGLERLVGFVRNRLLQASLRNALRVRRRLFLTLGLLGVGGALFVTALSVADSWNAMTDEVLLTRHYDVELHLAEPVSAATLDRLHGVSKAEIWGSAPVTVASESGLPISRTYPDGGHGSFTLLGAPDSTELVSFELRSGKWLPPGDNNAIVLNQIAASRVGPSPLGKRVELVVEGRQAAWQVVGVVEEVAAPATAYVRAGAFVERTGQELRVLRIATATNREPEATHAAVLDVQRDLAERGATVARAVPLGLLYNAMGEHVVVLIRSLLGLALMMAIVGVLALSSSMSTSIVERTREIGVLRAIGARPFQIRRMVLIEGWFVTLLSLPFALLLAVPLTWLVGWTVGQLSFQLPLALDISWLALAGWTAGILIVATVSSLVPARGAIRHTVREALGHV